MQTKTDPLVVKDLLVEIPGGNILLRDDRTKKEWEVKIQPFYLSKFPVTQKLYVDITGQNPSYFKGDQRPVEMVSWLDAANFCNVLSTQAGLTPCFTIEDEKVGFNQKANGYRLPTEAEWQYACQCGTKQTRYGNLDEIGWYKNNSGDQTHDVGHKMPNAWGLYDMLGNVWEWCADLYDTEVYGTYRIFRGGGWCDPERGCMATNRRRSHPTFKIDDLGFRLGLNIPF